MKVYVAYERISNEMSEEEFKAQKAAGLAAAQARIHAEEGTGGEWTEMDALYGDKIYRVFVHTEDVKQFGTVRLDGDVARKYALSGVAINLTNEEVDWCTE